MPSTEFKYTLPTDTPPSVVREDTIESGFIGTLQGLKYEYQVNAVPQRVKSIEDDAGNGYVWHTTGRGKTLTSFKASTLLKLNEHIHKCLFVVDRKDLDRQTREAIGKGVYRLRCAAVA